MNDPITDDDIALLVKQAVATRESVMRRLLGLPVRGRVGERVDKAIDFWNQARDGA